MDELDEMQTLLENKIIEISNLKRALQAQLSSLQKKPKHCLIIKQNLESLMVIATDFKQIFKQTKEFFKFQMFNQIVTDVWKKSSITFSNEQSKLKQQLSKIRHELDQQVKLNDLTKEEVLDLKQMINLHIQKSKKEIDQRDSIIRQLQNNNQTPSKHKQEQLVIRGEHLQTINQEEQINFTSRVFNYQQNANFKLVRQNITEISQQQQVNVLVTAEKQKEKQQSSKRTIESKTRTRFFIDDFRNVVQNTSQSVDSLPTSLARDRFSNIQNDYSDSSEVISMFEFGRIANHYQSISINDKENREKTDRISIDFSASQSRDTKSKSKEKKLELTYIQKTPELKSKDCNIMSGSKDRCSRFDKKERDSDKKLRVVSIEKNKKYAQSRNTAKWITQSLEKVDIYVGDKRTEQSYKGDMKGRLREGVGRLEYINGLVYQGEFKDNTRHGQGTLSLNGNLIYQGQWHRDKLSGKGVIHNIYLVNKRKIPQTCFLRTNSYYSGDFKDNTFNGRGIWIINACQRFQSFFKDGLPQGEFKYKNKYGDIQIGNSSYGSDK